MDFAKIDINKRDGTSELTPLFNSTEVLPTDGEQPRTSEPHASLELRVSQLGNTVSRDFHT